MLSTKATKSTKRTYNLRVKIQRQAKGLSFCTRCYVRVLSCGSWTSVWVILQDKQEQQREVIYAKCTYDGDK